ncbi:Bacterial regulatory protein, Fis family [compost metagenome]
MRRQLKSWDQSRIERIFDQLAALPAAAGEPCEPAVFTDAERAERTRILAALDVNGWRRQDTANTLGISRKVLWEKMRKLRLGAAQGETAEGIVDAS